MRLEGKTVLVTGAGRGLGRSCAVRFAAEGADLALLDVGTDIEGVPYPLATATQLEETAELCRRAGATVLAVTADVRDQPGVTAAVRDTVRRFGRIDVLVNNAGIAAPSGKVVHAITDEEWSLMLDVDLVGAFRMIREVAPHMVRERAGSIVNIASTAGLVGYRHFAAYVTAKHALVGLTRAAALDYAPMKIRVNALCPGSVRDAEQVDGRMLSEIARSLEVDLAEHEQTFVQAQPMNALIEPEDVAGTALWLAGDDSRQVTGTVVTVDGGFTAR
ncbi:dehydrogenase [Longispora fulva]|uniref:NAD(P)-dependent dehydrogenase (Short-subunit alcohol dehydrogenase family) n=1 Tax=Longispora fulva TaxID=619741 RepID=A0A8J7KII4_9ACTN|nr:SDR family oxidoreductase [Longispora fulva]MBG6134031.1 NAD(P)-dependent dehydrogenase (short-subunit alcohol dehydrogenase family) [Longispora fulva]GIG63549.1 dehydrogenase [Longispora fulva]